MNCTNICTNGMVLIITLMILDFNYNFIRMFLQTNFNASNFLTSMFCSFVFKQGNYELMLTVRDIPQLNPKLKSIFYIER